MKYEYIFLIIVLTLTISALIFGSMSINRVLEERLVVNGLTTECITSNNCRSLMLNTMEKMGFDKRKDERKEMYNLFLKYDKSEEIK